MTGPMLVAGITLLVFVVGYGLGFLTGVVVMAK